MLKTVVGDHELSLRDDARHWCISDGAVSIGGVGLSLCTAQWTAVEPDLPVQADLGEGRRVLGIGPVTAQPEVETDEQMGADEGDELCDAVDCFLQLVGLGVVVGGLQ